MAKYDAIVIGANNAGLVCGAFLEKKGLHTVIVEATDWIGGTGITTTVPEIDPDVKMNLAATGQGWVNPAVREELELDKYGFENFPLDPSLTTAFPDGQGYISIWHDPEKAAEEIARFSERDAAAYLKWVEKWKPVGEMLKLSYTQEPPTYGQMANGMISSTQGAIAYRDIFFRGVTSVMNHTFENDLVKQTFVPLMEGSNYGPKTMTPLFLITHISQKWGAIRHGYRGLMDALEAATRDTGCEIRLNSKVTKILVEDGKARGVVLESGEEILADNVISNLEPGNTMFNLVGEDKLDPFYIEQLNDIEYEAQGCTLNMVVDTMPDFGFPEDRFSGWFGFGPSWDQVEKAYYQYTVGEIPDDLQIIGYMPSYIDDWYAPEGKHVLTCFVFPLPAQPKGSSWEEKKQELYDKFEKKILEYAPNLEGHVLGIAGYTPGELAEKFNMTNGDIMHGIMNWDQLLTFRPMPGWSNRKTPIEGLYFSGAPTDHGGLSGATGYNAARAVLKDIERNK